MKRMEVKTQRGFTLLELVVVVCIIAILAAGGLVYYEKTMDDAKRTGVEIMANRFATAISLVRGQWIVESSMQLEGKVPNTYRVVLDQTPIFLNELGWPASTDGVSARSNDQTAEECYQLWETIMQNPTTTTVEGRSGNLGDEKGMQRYHISASSPEACRYELITKPMGSHYFEYNLRTGQVKVTVPPLA